MIIDCFAGGGGASLGIERALGVSPDIAINHDRAALAVHAANHPRTEHLRTDVWDVSPRKATGGRPVELAWFSPDCRHFSKAKGGAPVSDQVRSLAWVVVRWARDVRPAVIMLENVEEFATWGPLLPNGLPCPARRGWTFRRWWRELESLGYELDARELRACDYGAPTIRKRLFIIARRDGCPIVWPEPTHGPGRPQQWRVAADCIDWSLPVPSIFDRVRPLAEATQRRIARGLERYVLRHPQPFIVPIQNWSRDAVHSIDEPLRTVTAYPKGGGFALAAPYMVNTRNGERTGQDPRVRATDEPYWTVTAKGSQGALIAAWLAQHNGGMVGHDLREPMSTITQSGSHQQLCTAQLGQRQPVVRAWLAKYYGTAVGQELTAPLHSTTTKARFGLVTVLDDIADIGMRMLAPRELFRAQGFDERYQIDPVLDGKPLPKTEQVRLCGNSVCPPLAEALIAANMNIAERRVAS